MKGIYKITNTANGNVYIGQAVNINARVTSHINNLKSNNHVNKHLQNAWNKYGQDSFVFSVLELCEFCTAEQLTEREQYWINYYGGVNSTKNYNQREAGNSGTFSIETRNKISSSLKSLNIHLTEEKKQHLREIFTGRTVREDVKERIKNSQLQQFKLGRKCAFYGKHLSENHKKKISQTMKGRPCCNLGYRHTDETKEKIRSKLKGKPKGKWTEDRKLKLSKSLKGKHAWNKGVPSKYKGIKKSEKDKEAIRQGILKAKGYSVDQFDLNGNYIQTFDSTMEAERQTGVHSSGISACCRGLQKKSGGYIWKKH